MMKIFLKIVLGVCISLCISCKNSKSTPSVITNSVHSKTTNGSMYDENQKGIVLGNKEVLDPLENMRIKTVAGIDYYYDLSSPKFSSNECFYPYIKKSSNNKYEILLRIRHVAEEWLNTENVLITADNKDFSFQGTVVKTETKGKKVYKIELLEIPIKEDMFSVLEKVATSKEALGVLVGKEKYQKRIMSAEQKLAFQHVLNAYNYLVKNK